jgi:hypothetical protein
MAQFRQQREHFLEGRIGRIDTSEKASGSISGNREPRSNEIDESELH